MEQSALIAVMGPTGSGKSSFINLCTGQEDAKVYNTLTSGTGEITSYAYEHERKKIFLVDTPGFDDSYLTDKEVLRMLLAWLESSYRKGQKLAGIIYLHRISEPRMQGTTLSNFYVFRKLCGEGFYSNIILATTFWNSDLENGIGGKREQELIKTEEFWGSMIDKGSRVIRLPKTTAEARKLILTMIRKKPLALVAQEEIVNKGLPHDEIAASKELREAEAQREREIAHKQAQAQLFSLQNAKLQDLEKQKQEKEQRMKEEAERRVREQEERRKRLQEQQEQQERELRLAEIAAREEAERIKRETEELEARLAEIARIKANEVRQQKKTLFLMQLGMSLSILEQAEENTLCKYSTLPDGLTSVCDNCFRSIGSGVCYDCPLCEDFCLCHDCYMAPDVYCNEVGHYQSLKKRDCSNLEKTGCQRLRNPPIPGVDLLCDRCLEPTGAVYLHCCQCTNDSFDMCISCALGFRTCKKPWSLTGHPLKIHFRYPKSN